MNIHSSGGFYNELDYLVHLPILTNNDNRDTIYNTVIGRGDIVNGNITNTPEEKNHVVFKSPNVAGTKSIKNYYKENVNFGNDNDANIFTKLLYKFNNDDTFKAMRFKAADFTYLTELGVYPINKMWVLRRFEENVTVPDNLQDWDKNTTIPEPIQTIVGFLPNNKDEMFSLSFNEEWTTVNKRLDQIIVDILKTEFNLKSDKLFPVPGWSQGLLFEFLKQMGLTDYGYDSIPMGDPNVLQEGATRVKDNKADYGLISTLNIELDTSYEQKYIGDIDPGSAMLDIYQNILKFGTSETKYILVGDTSNNKILKSLSKANNSGNKNDWITFMVDVVDSFLKAIGNLFDNFKEIINKDNPNTKKDNPNTKKEEKSDVVKEKEISHIKNTLFDVSNSLVKEILASTVTKYRWALRGSIALMTGENSTPWHLTIGNPMSPYISVGNIVVSDVILKPSTELSYNDMPMKLNTSIKIKFGRNMGSNELFNMFNNGYKRVYSSKDESVKTGKKGTGKNKIIK